MPGKRKVHNAPKPGQQGFQKGRLGKDHVPTAAAPQTSRAAYGSLQNTMQAMAANPEPEVGMGATIVLWSDRMPATVVQVVRFASGRRKGQVRKIVIQRDKAERIDDNGYSEDQEWAITPDGNGLTEVATVRNDGSFRMPGGALVRVGARDKYYDFSF